MYLRDVPSASTSAAKPEAAGADRRRRLAHAPEAGSQPTPGHGARQASAQAESEVVFALHALRNGQQILADARDRAKEAGAQEERGKSHQQIDEGNLHHGT